MDPALARITFLPIWPNSVGLMTAPPHPFRRWAIQRRWAAPESSGRWNHMSLVWMTSADLRRLNPANYSPSTIILCPKHACNAWEVSLPNSSVTVDRILKRLSAVRWNSASHRRPYVAPGVSTAMQDVYKQASARLKLLESIHICYPSWSLSLIHIGSKHSEPTSTTTAFLTI